MKQNELEQIIKYQKQTLDYLEKWLFEEVEKDKKPDFLKTEEELAADEELDYDYQADKKLEEGLISEEEGETK